MKKFLYLGSEFLVAISLLVVANILHTLSITYDKGWYSDLW